MGRSTPGSPTRLADVETIIDRSTLEELRASLRGAAYAPSEEGYDEARKAWNLNAHQHPALVVMAAGAADVIGAVRLARDEGLGVGVMATGHGVASPCDGGVLINTSRMRGVRVDPEAQTARVEPGALWTDVIPEAQIFGLTGLAGSSVVGVVGYTMGGGFGWLGRKYGFNADSVRNFGIVTSMEFALYPLTTVYGGNLFYSLEQAGVGSESPLVTLELRQLGGALARPPADLSPIGRRDSRFIMFGVRMSPTPEVTQRLQEHLAYVAEEMRPYETGATFVNFLDQGDWTPERTRSSYSPEDWERLVELKDRYDPNNLFRFNRNIPPSSVRE